MTISVLVFLLTLCVDVTDCKEHVGALGSNMKEPVVVLNKLSSEVQYFLDLVNLYSHSKTNNNMPVVPHIISFIVLLNV